MRLAIDGNFKEFTRKARPRFNHDRGDAAGAEKISKYEPFHVRIFKREDLAMKINLTEGHISIRRSFICPYAN
jgi:hypothetical protein